MFCIIIQSNSQKTFFSIVLCTNQQGDLRQQWPEPGCWPAVFVKTMVCWGCSLSRAQKTWLSLLFKVFRTNVAAVTSAENHLYSKCSSDRKQVFIRDYCFNRPFATNDHMVQNPPCWRASSLLFPHWDIKTKRPEPVKLDLNVSFI